VQKTNSLFFPELQAKKPIELDVYGVVLSKAAKASRVAQSHTESTDVFAKNCKCVYCLNDVITHSHVGSK
jgi:hypothetical protein